MSNAQFIFTNILEDATLSGTNIHSDYDVNDIIDYRRNKLVLGTTDVSYPTPPYSSVPDLIIKFNNPVLSYASGVAIIWKYLSAGATVRLELYDDINQTGNKVYDSGVLDVLRYRTFFELDWCVGNIIQTWDYKNDLSKVSYWTFDSTRHLSGQLTISNPTNETGYNAINSVFLGRVYTTNRNISWGSTWLKTDTSTNHIVQDGSNIVVKGTEGYTITIQYDNLSIEDRNLFKQQLIETNSIVKPFFCDIMPCADYYTQIQHRGLFRLAEPSPFTLSQAFLSSVGFSLKRV